MVAIACSWILKSMFILKEICSAYIFRIEQDTAWMSRYLHSFYSTSFVLSHFYSRFCWKLYLRILSNYRYSTFISEWRICSWILDIFLTFKTDIWKTSLRTSSVELCPEVISWNRNLKASWPSIWASALSCGITANETVWIHISTKTCDILVTSAPSIFVTILTAVIYATRNKHFLSLSLHRAFRRVI